MDWESEAFTGHEKHRLSYQFLEVWFISAHSLSLSAQIDCRYIMVVCPLADVNLMLKMALATYVISVL